MKDQAVAVIGTGAVAAVAASGAEQAGRQVVMCARSPVSSAVLERDGREQRLAAAITCDPDQVRPAAWVLLAEAVAVGMAEGARLSGEDVQRTLEFYDGFASEDGTSMLYDRLAGRPLEHEHVSGTVVRLGRRHGVPVPANQALYALPGALA
jgi:ketopantoate reductase